MDELLQSGVFEDVDKELAELKARLAISPAAPELTSVSSPAATSAVGS